MNSLVLLTVAQMAQADRAAMTAGISGPALMNAAGWAVAREVRRRWSRRHVAILCGPGNNGGDGFVAARHLARAGWPVRVALLGDYSALKGDAAWAASLWRGPVTSLTPEVLDGCGLVVDALFGTGLARPLDGMARAVVEATLERHLDCLAVDIPSGIHGDSGQVLGAAARAVATVTFFRRKPGHLLLPGRELCGDVVVADIGIPESVLGDIAPRTFENAPGLWTLPTPALDGHKYGRGHAVVVGGGSMTGAGRLAARGARRVGAGVLTVAAPQEAVALYASDAPGVIVTAVNDAAALRALLADPRRNAILVGPGGGERVREMALAALGSGRACVLDADALTAFRDQPESLFAAIVAPTVAPCVLTPHDGEYSALFGEVGGSRLERAHAAAVTSGAVVLLKGPDTVIAAPDGRAAINSNAPPDLATAGSGDVLAGFILGLLAQGMDAFSAAAAGAWLHGEAGRQLGRGLIAEDIPEALPSLFRIHNSD